MSVKNRNLHDLEIETDCGAFGQIDYSVTSGQIEAHFKDLESKLIERIGKADLILGCVAWLTSAPILKALAQKHCSIVVQKEDFLRPDLDTKSGFEKKLQALYSSLQCEITRYNMPGIVSELSTCTDPSVEPIRCVGNHNADKEIAWARSHHKFVVFCKTNERDDVFGRHYEVTPYAVWTGSFNFTKTAAESFENALYITDPVIVGAYIREYTQIFALSEPLNWTETWSAPEFRIGT